MNWYYVDRHGQRHGPVSAASIGDAVRSGDLRADNLVWHAGLTAWQPLQMHAETLGLHLSPEPPPLPGPPPPPGESTAGSWQADSPTGSMVEKQEIVYAGFWRRFAALFLDQIILGAAFYGLLVIGVIAMAVGNTGSGQPSDGPMPAFGATIWLIWIAYLIVAWAYYALQHSSKHQATVGKRLLGIKLVNSEGQRIGRGNATLRWFSSALSYLTLYIGFLMAAFTDRKRALHDMIADTLVVDRWAYTKYPERQQREPSGCLIVVIIAAVIVPFVLAILAAIAIPAYQDYVVRANIKSALVSADPVKLAVGGYYAETGTCPANGDGLIAQPGYYADQFVSRMDIGTMQDTGWCGIQLTTTGIPNDRADGKLIWLELEPESGNWLCSSEIADKYLPSECRP